MSAIVGTLASVVGGTLVKMAARLMTEKFIKTLVIQALEAIVKRTETKEDDRLLQEAKKEWLK